MEPATAVTVSEATGYALLISLLKRNRDDFDGFLGFWRRFLSPEGLMYWQLLRDFDGGEIQANQHCLNSATDGDMDIAYALLTAAKVWNVPKYKELALRVCNALLTQCYNAETGMLTLGDWCVPGHTLHCVARPSDFLPSHLALFAAEDSAHADIWERCRKATLQALQDQLTQHATGLMADFVTFNDAAGRFEPVPGKILERTKDPDYYFNSCRTPWRLSVYYAESHDERVLPILKALTAFFEAQDKVYAGYTLDGTPVEKWCHLSFLAPVCCMFKVMGSPHLSRMTGNMYRLGEDTYFGDTIQLLCELQTADLPADQGRP